MKSLLFPHTPRDPVLGAEAMYYGQQGPVGLVGGMASPINNVAYEGDPPTRGLRIPEGMSREAHAKERARMERRFGENSSNLPEKFEPGNIYLIGEENWDSPYVVAHERRHSERINEVDNRIMDAFRALGSDNWKEARDGLVSYYFRGEANAPVGDKEKTQAALELIDKHKETIIDNEAKSFVSDIMKAPAKAREGTAEFTDARILFWRQYFDRVKNHESKEK